MRDARTVPSGLHLSVPRIGVRDADPGQDSLFRCRRLGIFLRRKNAVLVCVGDVEHFGYRRAGSCFLLVDGSILIDVQYGEAGLSRRRGGRWGVLRLGMWNERQENGSGDQGADDDRAELLRITSYNVCYTKLLRSMSTVVSLSGGALVANLISVILLISETLRQTVITSYSIHYTKLYDAIHAG